MIGLADEYTQSMAGEKLHPEASKADIKAAEGEEYGPAQWTNPTSMMGLGALKQHDDKKADPPRHVREFALFVARYLGGRWHGIKK